MKICTENGLHLCEDCPQRWALNVETKDGEDLWFCFPEEEEAKAWWKILESGGEINGTEIAPHTAILFKPKEGCKK